MASQYPDAYDTFPIPGQSQKTESGALTHSELHRDLGLSIEAIEAALGLNPAGAFSNVVARLEFLESLALTGDSVVILEGLADHLTDAVDAHDASAISFIPTGTVSSTNVQAAIAEVAAEAASNTLLFYSETATDASIITPSGSVTINANTGISFAGSKFSSVGSVGHKLSVVNPTGSTETINALNFSTFDLTLDQPCTITISGTPASDQDVTIKVIIRGGFAAEFDNVYWPDGVMPLHDGVRSGYIIMYDNTADVWLGMQSGTGFALP